MTVLGRNGRNAKGQKDYNRYSQSYFLAMAVGLSPEKGNTWVGEETGERQRRQGKRHAMAQEESKPGKKEKGRAAKPCRARLAPGLVRCCVECNPFPACHRSITFIAAAACCLLLLLLSPISPIVALVESTTSLREISTPNRLLLFANSPFDSVGAVLDLFVSPAFLFS